MTPENQIPIPDEIGDHLGVAARGQVEFVVEDDGRVVVRPRQYRELTLEEVFGSVPAITGQSLDLREEIEDAFGEAMDEKVGRWERQQEG